MTERELFEAIGHVDDDLILAADAPVKKRRRVVHLHWQQVVSVAACAVDCPPDRGADGVIETSVDRDAFPETDGCSNFGTGYSYWVTGDNAVVVEIDGEYCEFEAN